MKTSELKRILSEDLVETFSENEDVIFGVYWTVKKREQRLRVFGVIPLNVLKALGEYVNTPIKEREDEKKYYLKAFERYEFRDAFLNETKENKEYFLDTDKSEDEFAKTIFTEKEISTLPSEIKGAIECGFFVKVEVK